ncbi:DUF6281 family protein [Streptomyces caniscabiei]|uniref:DUF6281 family protein n=1 Tax=Streptomyces caniscabiei TaxID=2746961 RepID=UPI0029B70218|nr:DUF6281 family protein [Streptomyces caniscabiei]MDX2604209.1 DUF6281 family protein [Streptomyces caniscabiei]MDX2739210.1 DUF6281 family protein [Streptomyces caniscabiei]MDX2784319.1 DUF6281 family protein [Streptomyces caniscabiei]
MLSGTRVRIALAALATVPLAVGCAALDTGGTSSASCVFAVDYGDRQYVEAGEVDTALGAKVGTARDSVCEDQGGGEEDQVPVDERAVYTAYAVEGVDTEDAIAVRESPGGEVRVLVHAAEDEGVNAAVERVFGETGGDDGGDSGAAKCALVVEYGEGEYSYRGDVEFEVGAGAGEARAMPCGDTPGEVDTTAEPREYETYKAYEAYEAYEVKGLDPADAVAVRLSPDEEPLLVVRVTDDLPPEIEKLLPAEEF